MKKTFLFRLVVITFFCFASLVIKSETKLCNLRCSQSAQKAAVMQSLILNDAHESPLHHDEGFFIKI
ncbi:MAG: hypothetical protein ABI863_08200 [Ginsengibacter sp.]